MTMSALQPVTSSNIKAVAFDPVGLVLRVQFSSGAQYDYAGVPQATYDALLAAESVGSYFASNVRGTYQGTLVAPAVEHHESD